jgi:hypothetical protein
MFAAVLTAAFLAGADPKPEVRLTRPDPDGPWVVEATGFSAGLAERLKASPNWSAADWAGVLRVVVAGGTGERPPLLGSYSVADGRIRFEPRFPLVPGVKYQATLADGAAPVVAELVIPKPKAEPAAVAAVYPSGDKLPENMLRLYVHFSKPMARGGAYKYVKLVNDTDKKTIEMPFLELDEELWTADQTRFTLLIDPGRIKREVKPREDLGPALEAGKTFTLVVAKDWRDADGDPLKAEFRKTFAATPPDRTPIDPEKWTITPPKGAGPVTVGLEKPLDRALLQRMVWLVGPDGKKTVAEVADGERKLVFAPAGKAWPTGRYRLVIDTRLEDVCGNRVGEPFEVDVFKPVERSIEVETVTRVFEVK